MLQRHEGLQFQAMPGWADTEAHWNSGNEQHSHPLGHKRYKQPHQLAVHRAWTGWRKWLVMNGSDIMEIAWRKKTAHRFAQQYWNGFVDGRLAEARYSALKEKAVTDTVPVTTGGPGDIPPRV